jgi:RND family efflux transporter MFP subunit
MSTNPPDPSRRRRARGIRVAALLGAALAVTSPALAQSEAFDCIVKPNKVVASLDSRVEEANVTLAESRAAQTAALASARAQLDMQERRLRRLQPLFENKHLAERNYEEAETDHAVAVMRLRQLEEERRLLALEVERARRMLEMRSIMSPIGGIVTARHVSPGEYVEGTKVVTIAEVTPLKVEVVVPTRFLGRVAVGDAAIVEPEAPVGGQHRAQVRIVDQVVDAASGTFGIQLEIANADNAVLAGLRCQVKFLPREASQTSMSPGQVSAHLPGPAPRK